uniref:NADH-ubiquinone oxidoreductase chain 5 n=1 Tax=Gonatocerus sp. ZCS-2018 TaxID=2305128 RepID=A0A346PZ43_9HYME|nr:NADH dehydrogenase subunit 5 [Gonatocerus sp. ZCS-2018]
MMYFMISFFFLMISMFFLNFSLLFFLMKNSMFIEWNLINFFSIKLNMLIYLDWLSNMFIFTVLIISSMIMIYSSEYMYSDKNINQFFMLLILFILSMIFMVISPNLISILLGWDGLGLVSYCLVIFYQSKYSYSCGNLTIFSNRIGDIFLIMSISMMFIMGSWNFMNFNNFIYKLLIFMIIVTSFTKSAQFPFSSWLPMAMAAPTPVSSLVHSSTLVTAGIYLLIRFKEMIYSNNNLMLFIMLISLITMFMSSMCAIFEYDFKKIIAYSTLSQMSLMMMIFSIKMFNMTFFHLIIHAMFKSMMFMCSGIFIHSLLNFQDIRFYGNMKKFLPMTSIMFFISNLSLCGIPFLSGFYSKDIILEFFLIYKLNYLIYLLFLISIMMTLIYSFRLLYYLMFKKFNFLNYYCIEDSKIMNFSMMILLMFSIFLGSMFNWIIFFSLEKIFLSLNLKLLILNLLMFGIFFGIILFLINYYKFNYLMKLFFGTMWFSYKLINYLLNLLLLSKFMYNYFDKGWSEFLLKNTFSLILNNKNYSFIKINNILMMMFLLTLNLMIFFMFI